MAAGLAASLLTQVGSSLFSGWSQMDAGLTAEKIAKNNETLIGYRQSDRYHQLAQQIGAIRAAGAQATGGALAATAVNGIESTVGAGASPFSISAMNAAADESRARAGAARDVWGMEQEKQDLLTQGRLAKRAGLLGAIGAGMTGGGQMAQSVSSYVEKE